MLFIVSFEPSHHLMGKWIMQILVVQHIPASCIVKMSLFWQVSVNVSDHSDPKINERIAKWV